MRKPIRCLSVETQIQGLFTPVGGTPSRWPCPQKRSRLHHVSRISTGLGYLIQSLGGWSMTSFCLSWCRLLIVHFVGPTFLSNHYFFFFFLGDTSIDLDVSITSSIPSFHIYLIVSPKKVNWAIASINYSTICNALYQIKLNSRLSFICWIVFRVVKIIFLAKLRLPVFRIEITNYSKIIEFRMDNFQTLISFRKNYEMKTLMSINDSLFCANNVFLGWYSINQAINIHMVTCSKKEALSFNMRQFYSLCVTWPFLPLM